MTEALWAFGTKLKKAGVAIAELTNINGLDLDSDEIDVTNHDSPGGYEEVIQSIRRTGVVTLEGNFVPGDDGQAALMADYLSGVVGNYTIEFPEAMAAEWSFTAYVKKAPSTKAPHDDKVPFSAELRVTGQPSLDLTYSGGLTDLAGIEEEATAALTLVPAFNNAKYEYNVTVNTASTWIKLTPTAADHTITVQDVVVATTEQSGEVALGAAATVTTVSVVAKEANKIARTYKLYIARP